MMPFTTAERKVLGVAAPTPAADAAQLALSAAAQSVQSAAAADRLRQSDLRAGGRAQPQVQTAIDQATDDAHSPPSHQARRDQRFRRAQSEPIRRDRRKQQPHHGASARRRGLDLAARRRHRHHEHPARLGHRAHARDRPAHGDRRAPPACPAAVPRRGGVSQRQRRASPAFVTGIALSVGISLVVGWPAPVSLAAVAGGFLFSAAVGVFFGYYPARKAAGSIRSRRCATSERGNGRIRSTPGRSHIAATRSRARRGRCQG